MFDTMHLKCYTGDKLKWQNLDYVNPNQTFGEYKNLRIYKNPEYYFIKGSLPKYYFGNNLEVLSRKTTMQAVEKLSDDLGIRVKQSTLCRFDISCNFIMQNEVRHYNYLLEELSRFKKSIIRNYETIYFTQYKIELMFYNKTLEMGRNKQAIPEAFKPYKNRILRYEMKYKNRINQIFKREINLNTLTEEKFYIELIKKWKEYYFQITKLNKPKFNAMALTDVRKFQNQLMLKGLNALGGFEEVLQMIELSRNEIGRHRVKRLKDKLRALKQAKELIEVNPLINELDEKIRNANSNFR